MPQLRFSILPVSGPVTARFGEEIVVAGRARVHRGVDFAVPDGTPVRAPAAGAVVTFFNDGSFGTAVCLDHEGTPWYSLYAHLSAARVAPGERVAVGDIVGLSGNTGLSTGPHLHWQVCRDTSFPTDISRSANPLDFLEQSPPDHGVDVPALTAHELNAALQARFQLIRLAFDADVEKVYRALSAVKDAR
jgi:murein DD-endopeptidase MepM/ murein hydrolase activator NlpD